LIKENEHFQYWNNMKYLRDYQTREDSYSQRAANQSTDQTVWDVKMFEKKSINYYTHFQPSKLTPAVRKM